MLTGTRAEALAWRLALASFTLAAATGAFMRFGLFLGFPWGLEFTNVRHAHSHLMFFSWATPALALCAHAVLRSAGRRLPGGATLAVTAALAGLTAYVPFMLSGYGLMRIGATSLPVSMMASGLNGVVWYLLALLYVLGSRKVARTPAVRLMDGAVAILVVSTFGVLLLMQGGMAGTGTSASIAANAEYYTTLFADGWFGIGLLAALALTRFPRAQATGFGAATWTLAAGLTARSGAKLAEFTVASPALRVIEGLGGLLAAAAWLWLVVALWRGRSTDRSTGDVVAAVALGLVGLKAVVELAIALPAGATLVAREGLRVLLLHAFLLGAVSLGLASSGRVLLGARAWPALGLFAVAVAVMILCLVPLTGLWPAGLSGAWTLRAAAYSSLGPAVLGAYALLLSRRPDAPAARSR